MRRIHPRSPGPAQPRARLRYSGYICWSDPIGRRSRGTRRGITRRTGSGCSTRCSNEQSDVLLQIQNEDPALCPRAADQYVASAPVFFEHLVAMVGLAREIGRQTRPAIAELAGGSDGNAVTLEHLGDRLAGSDFVVAAGLCQPDTKRAV